MVSVFEGLMVRTATCLFNSILDLLVFLAGVALCSAGPLFLAARLPLCCQRLGLHAHFYVGGSIYLLCVVQMK